MRRFFTSMACLLLLTGFAGTRLARAADHGPQQAATSEPKAAVDSTQYVGQETCATCHEEVVKKFGTNPHSRLALEHGGKGVTCEGCHGPGKAHVEGGGDVTKIRRFDKLSAEGNRPDVSGLPCRHASEFRPLPARESERRLHQLPQRARAEDRGRAAQGQPAAAVLPVPL